MPSPMFSPTARYVVPLLLLSLLLVAPQDTSAERAAAPPLRPCESLYATMSFPTNSQKDVPTDAGVFVRVSNSQNCELWLQGKLKLTANDFEIPGEHSVTTIRDIQQTLLFRLQPKQPLQPGTEHTMTLTMPKSPEGNIKKLTFRFTTGKEPAPTRTPQAFFAFAGAEWITNSRSCQLSLEIKGENTSPGDNVFVHHFPATKEGKAADIPAALVSGNQLDKGATARVALGIPEGTYCSGEQVCIQLKIVKNDGTLSTMPEYCTKPTPTQAPPSTPPPVGGCQALPLSTFSWTGLLLLCLVACWRPGLKG